MSPAFQWIVVEGLLDADAALTLLDRCGVATDGVEPLIASNCALFWKKADAFNNAVLRSGGLCFGLVDQENPEDCPPDQIKHRLSQKKAASFVLRIAERMLEDWLLADEENLSRFLGVTQGRIRKEKSKARQSVDGIHPKRMIANLARTSRIRSIREDLMPESGSRGLVGKGYTTQMRRFIRQRWDPLASRARNDSLNRAIEALQRFAS